MKPLLIALAVLLCRLTAIGQTFSETLPIFVEDGNLYVKVFINQKGPYNFLFDCGASGVGRVDEHLVKDLGLTVSGYEENSDGHQIQKLPLIGISEIRLGSIKFNNVGLMSRNYNQKVKQTPVDGLIGRDFFAEHLISINFAENKMTISNGALRPGDEGVITYNVPIRITGKIGGIDTTFNMDTGSNLHMHIPKRMMEKLSFANTGVTRTAKKANTSFIIQEAIVQNELSLSGIKLSGQKVYYSETAKEINVGNAFFKDYILTIDQKHKLVKISKPGK